MKKLCLMLVCFASVVANAQGALKTDVVMLVKSNINLEYEFYAAPHITAGLAASANMESDTFSAGLNGYYNFNGTFSQGPKVGGGVYFPDFNGVAFFGFVGYQLRVEQFMITPAIAIGSDIGSDVDFKLNLGIRI